MSSQSQINVVLGSQWGDEGKGKIVDVLSGKADVVCRCQGGSNAGHTVIVEEKEFKFQLIPSGIINESVTVIIGNGVVLHVPTLMKEIENNTMKGILGMKERMKISDRTHLVFDQHQQIDGFLENLRNKSSLGTTKRGIGPAYATKALRNSIRVSDLVGDFEKFTNLFKELSAYHQRLFHDLEINIESEIQKYKEYAEILKPMVVDTIPLIYEEIKKGSNILVEGANATMLDIDFGTYPYVTSSNCGIGGAITGLGIPAKAINNVYGVVKAYTTRVGGGVLPSELFDETGVLLQTIGNEVGTNTGRTRRCGWLDLVVVKYTHMINGYTALALTKIDVLDTLKEIKIAIGYKLNGVLLPSFPANLSILEKVEVVYATLPGWNESLKDIRKFEDLPENARKYIKFIEDYVNVPVKWVSVGKSRDATIEVF
ncbi:adenylosuccinate synthetase isoform X1 [Hydra vulgaris]|uniref:Adenylosuccinate synthetase n=1 Tax=Hydra vulgaris TaxID=6087 RepID=T2MAA5_HYDVU|nr:adenylosuccinate synthetase [Hydra vulgaris]